MAGIPDQFGTFSFIQYSSTLATGQNNWLKRIDYRKHFYFAEIEIIVFLEYLFLYSSGNGSSA
jgi:hypothetical protein